MNSRDTLFILALVVMWVLVPGGIAYMILHEFPNAIELFLSSLVTAMGCTRRVRGIWHKQKNASWLW